MSLSEFNSINDWKTPTCEQYEDYFKYSSELIPDLTLTNQHVLGKGSNVKSEEESDSDDYELSSHRNRIYIPGKVFFDKTKQSQLTKSDQAICLKVLSHFKTGGSEANLTETEKHNYGIYKSLLNRIHQENAEFVSLAKQEWERSKKNHLSNIHFLIRKHAEKAWKNRLDLRKLYPRYYKFGNEMISLSYEESEPKVLVNLLHSVGHFGNIAEYLSPKIFLERYLHWGFPNSSKRYTLNSKLPVSQDDNVTTFIKHHDFDVVCTASTLTKLMDDSDYNGNWDIPVVIKHHTLAGKTIKVVYIDKPLPKKHPNQHDFMIKSFKDLIRTSYCRFPSVCFPVAEDLRLNPKIVSVNKKQENNKKFGSVENLQSITEDNKSDNSAELHLDTCRKRRAGSLSPNYAYQPTPKRTKITLPGDPLINNKIIHNVNYKIWSVALTPTENHLLKKQVSKAEIKFLVRCKIDACEPYNKNEVNSTHTADIGPGEPGSPLKPLVILPKIEHQIKLGANISTKSEVIKQWSSLFFRPHSELKKVRLTSYNREVIAIDGVQLPMVNHEAMSYYKYKPALRLGVLHKVFSKLLTLEPGNYLLHHKAKQGYFVNVLQAEKSDLQFSESANVNNYNLHSEYSKKNCNMVVVNDVPWCSIDVHYILPQHLAYKRMPGLFAPFVVPTEDLKRKKNARKSQKRKMKKLLKEQGESVDNVDI